MLDSSCLNYLFRVVETKLCLFCVHSDCLFGIRNIFNTFLIYIILSLFYNFVFVFYFFRFIHHVVLKKKNDENIQKHFVFYIKTSFSEFTCKTQTLFEGVFSYINILWTIYVCIYIFRIFYVYFHKVYAG